MFRFSIRELMLVTLVVAVSVGWAIDHWRPSNIYRKMDMENGVMKEGLKYWLAEALPPFERFIGWYSSFFRPD